MMEVEMMDCGTARHLLWPAQGPRRVTDEIARAQAHVSRCPACRQFLEDMRAMAERIRRAAPRFEAPTEVRDRLFRAVARARTMTLDPAPMPAPWPRRRRWLATGVAAVLALVSLVAGWQRLARPTEEQRIAAFADDHRHAVTGDAIISSDSLTVTHWLAARLPIAVEVPRFPGAALRGARLCLMKDERGAVVEYVLDGRRLSYYVVPASVVPPRRASSQPPGREPEFRYAASGGYRVVAWQDAGLTHALVADLPETHLADLARYCVHQMMSAFQGIANMLPG
jgi:anti-sigma factor RsiW